MASNPSRVWIRSKCVEGIPSQCTKTRTHSCWVPGQASRHEKQLGMYVGRCKAMWQYYTNCRSVDSRTIKNPHKGAQIQATRFLSAMQLLELVTLGNALWLSKRTLRAGSLLRVLCNWGSVFEDIWHQRQELEAIAKLSHLHKGEWRGLLCFRACHAVLRKAAKDLPNTHLVCQKLQLVSNIVVPK